MKQVTLMHKDIETVTFSMNEDGFCTRILSIENEAHLPPALRSLDQPYDISLWLCERRINESRPDVKALKESGITDPKNFLPLHYTSLYDCYWIRLSPEETFSDMTLYQQPIAEDVFSFMEDQDQPFDIVLSRDTGNLTLPFSRECRCLQDEDNPTVFYFLIRTELMEQPRYLEERYRERVPVVDGDYFMIYEEPFFRFSNATSPAVEYVSAEDLYSGAKKNPIYRGMEPEQIFLSAVSEEKIPKAKDYLCNLIALDNKYHVTRDLRSFGYFRDPDTLEPFGFAPVFFWPKKERNDHAFRKQSGL